MFLRAKSVTMESTLDLLEFRPIFHSKAPLNNIVLILDYELNFQEFPFLRKENCILLVNLKAFLFEGVFAMDRLDCLCQHKKAQLQLVKYGLLMRYLLGVLETFKAHGICPLCHMFMVGVSVLPCGHCYCTLCSEASQDVLEVKCPICHSQRSIERNGISTSRLYAIEAVIEDCYLALSTIYANLEGQQLPPQFAYILATKEINPDFLTSQIQQFLNNRAKAILTSQCDRNSFLNSMWRWTNSREGLLKPRGGFRFRPRELFNNILNWDHWDYDLFCRVIICELFSVVVTGFLGTPEGEKKIEEYLTGLPWMYIAKSIPQIFLTAGIGCWFYYAVLTGQGLHDIWESFQVLWETGPENIAVDEQEAEEEGDDAQIIGRVKSWIEIRNFLYHDFSQTEDIGNSED